MDWMQSARIPVRVWSFYIVYCYVMFCIFFCSCWMQDRGSGFDLLFGILPDVISARIRSARRFSSNAGFCLLPAIRILGVGSPEWVGCHVSSAISSTMIRSERCFVLVVIYWLFDCCLLLLLMVFWFWFFLCVSGCCCRCWAGELVLLLLLVLLVLAVVVAAYHVGWLWLVCMCVYMFLFICIFVKFIHLFMYICV